MSNKEFAVWIIKMLTEFPEQWQFERYSAKFRTLDIWTSNRPYADLTIYPEGRARIGNWLQRRTIRKLMDDVQRRNAVAKAEAQ